MDLIHIRDLRVLTVIGALPHEQEQAQPIRVDLDLHVDLTEAGISDELDDTVNYGLVADEIAAMAADNKFVLLERLADEIARNTLRFDRVEAVDVTVTKLRPPVATALESTPGPRRRKSVAFCTIRAGSRRPSRPRCWRICAPWSPPRRFSRR